MVSLIKTCIFQLSFFTFFLFCYLLVVTGNIIIIDKTSFFCSWNLFELYYLTTFIVRNITACEINFKICFPVAALDDSFFGATKTANEICLALKEER